MSPEKRMGSGFKAHPISQRPEVQMFTVGSETPPAVSSRKETHSAERESQFQTK